MLDVKRLCLVGAAILFTVSGAPAGAQDLPEPTAATQVRSFTAGRFALEIGGTFAGFVDLVEGGNGFGDVVEEQLASGATFRKKHLAGVGYRAIRLQVGSDMSQVLADWIKATFAGSTFLRKDGAIVALDHTLTERRRVNFFHALITEVGMPALDASSKDPAKLTVVLEPEFTRTTEPHPGKYAAQLCKTKAWLTSNFRLNIDGVDMSKTRAVDALAVKVVFSSDDIGDVRDIEKTPTYVSFSNVVVEVLRSGSQSLEQWFQSFVIQGNATDDQEKSGSLEYLDPAQGSALLTLNFNHVGIFELAPDSGGSSDKVATLIAKMYVESMTFNFTATCGN